VETLQLPTLTSLLLGEYPAIKLLSTVNSAGAPGLLSRPCRAQLNCQPSTNWVPGWRPFHANRIVFSSQADFQQTESVYCQSVRLGAKHLQTHFQNFSFNWTLAVIVFMSVVYNCCWCSPAQSFSGPTPAGLMTTFYCLRFERARSPYLYPPGTGWPSHTPRHWVPFPSPFTTRRATVEIFDPASSARTTSKTPFFYCCASSFPREHVYRAVA
jgi:hypothetical protein